MKVIAIRQVIISSDKSNLIFKMCEITGIHSRIKDKINFNKFHLEL